LTGFSPSIVRAAVMVGFVLAGELFLRETDGLTLLSIALLLLLFINPYALLSVGLQLSFLSCLGILLLEPYISELQKKLKGRGGYLRGLLAGSASLFLTSCAAVVFTFPVIAYTFGSLSWLAPLANLLFVPVFTPILTLLLLSVLVYSVIPAVGVALAFLPGQALALMEGLFGFLAGAGVGTLQVSDGWVFLPIVLSCIAIGSMLLFRKKGALLFVCFSLASVSSLSVCALAEALRSPAEYVILSRTESFLYVSRGEEGVLLDLGGAPSGYTLPEECFVTVYVVTEADAFSLDRLTETVSTQAIDRLYLPVSHIDGTKNDLTFFLALGEASGCEIILYHRVVEEPLLTYSLAEGTAVTPYGISAVLTSAPVTLSDETVWVLSPFAELPEVEAEQVYLPFAADLTQDLPAGDLHFYHETIIYHNGEVTVP
jgi:ComEC/Rec2-related protein